MYQALYRKYRPKTLEDVCGQNTIVRIIKNSVEKKQINHAYLFAGPRGTGKTSIAKIFGKIVNCSNLENCVPCGQCPSCTEKNNSDIIEIDAASNNGVDEIRELRNNVNLVPSLGKYKVYIIDEVHMLTTGAFNALLKTLEEPPAHVIFVLATTDPHKIPETIISRCQRFDFKRISDVAIVENLSKIAQKENIEIDNDALYEIARLSAGGMRDSVGMLDQARAYSDGKITIDDIHDINGTITPIQMSKLISEIFNGKIDEILENTDKFEESGKNFIKITEEMINFLRNLLLFKEAPEYFKNNIQNTSVYEEFSENIPRTLVLKYIEELNKYILEMKDTNNTKLLFEILLIKLGTSKENNELNNIVSQKEPVIKQEIPKKELSSKPEVVETETKQVNKEKKYIPEPTPLPINDDFSNDKPKTPEKTNSDNSEILEKINQIKLIRIDNTLSKFNKRLMKEILPKLEDLNELILNPDYSDAASIVLDGTLKAASDENLIFVYRTSRTSQIFNEQLINIEETIEKLLNKHYNLISTSLDEWEIIKDEFNNKKRPFIYKKENFNIKDLLNPDNQDIINMFEDILEYN